MATKRAARGRPRKISGGKTAIFSTRITPELRQELERSAAASGITLTQEIVSRLRRSFDLDKEREQIFQKFGGHQNYAVCLLFSGLMEDVSRAAGKRWTDDPWAYKQVRQGILRLLDEWCPPGEVKQPVLREYPPELAQRIGEFLAGHLLANLSFNDNEGDPGGRWWLRLRDDLGDLFGRRRAEPNPSEERQ